MILEIVPSGMIAQISNIQALSSLAVLFLCRGSVRIFLDSTLLLSVLGFALFTLSLGRRLSIIGRAGRLFLLVLLGLDLLFLHSHHRRRKAR
jgi:hypothetical protein